MKKFLVLFGGLVAMYATITFAADSQTVTPTHFSGSKLTKTTIVWEGSATGTKTDVPVHITGKISHVVTDPGPTAPLDNYDITILDSNGIDVMNGELVDRDTTTTEFAYPTYDGTNASFRYTGGTHAVAFTDIGGGDVNGEIHIYWIAE